MTGAATINITTFIIMPHNIKGLLETFSINDMKGLSVTMSIMTFSIKGLYVTMSIMTFSIKGLFVTYSINDTHHEGLVCDTQHKCH